MGFGGPYSLDDVEPFCRNLMGREPSPEVVERVKLRYLTIGGRSPLPEIARSISEKLSDQLKVPVAYGMRYWRPFIAGAVAELVQEQGVDRIVAVSLSPFESTHSSGAYRAALNEAVAGYSVEVVEAPSFRRTVAFLDALARGVAESLEDIPSGRNAVLFTAHSLPADEIAGQPYVEQLRETATGVAAQSGFELPVGDCQQSWLPGIKAYGSAEASIPWLLSYQSKGARPGPWLEPDVQDCVRAMAKAGFDGVVFTPIGFATDHMETLYDLDVEASGLALDLGMEFHRSPVPNDGPEMIEALADVVRPLL